jgi:hypothetical protein
MEYRDEPKGMNDGAFPTALHWLVQGFLQQRIVLREKYSKPYILCLLSLTRSRDPFVTDARETRNQVVVVTVEYLYRHSCTVIGVSDVAPCCW